MQVKTDQLRIKPKLFQEQFLTSLKRHPAFVAAWGTGKSMFGIMRGIMLSEQYPGNLGMIVRKEFVALRDSTMKDYEKYTGRRVNVQAKEDRLSNKSVIMFRHAKELTSANLQNVNLGWFLIEQAEEFDTSDVFWMLNGRLRREHGVKFRTGFIIANANGHNWIWDLWPLGGRPQKEDAFPAWEATTFDNQENLPKDFMNSLDFHRKYRPDIYNQYVMNDHSVGLGGNWFIPINLIESALTVHFQHPDERRIITCDPASSGDNMMVCYAMVNTQIVQEKIFPPGERDPMKLAGELIILKRLNKASLIVVDAIGVGEGICSRLAELGHSVLAINSAKRSKDPSQFLNTRSEMWWHAADMFRDHKISFEDVSKIDFDTLKKQLSNVKFVIVRSDGKTKAEHKEEVKKRIGCSPDYADAYVMGLYGLQFAKTTEQIARAKNPQKYDRYKRTGRKSKGYMSG